MFTNYVPSPGSASASCSSVIRPESSLTLADSYFPGDLGLREMALS